MSAQIFGIILSAGLGLIGIVLVGELQAAEKSKLVENISLSAERRHKVIVTNAPASLLLIAAAVTFLFAITQTVSFSLP